MHTGAQKGPDEQQADQELDLSELQGVLRINTRLDGTVAVKPEHSAAALATMSRFAVDHSGRLGTSSTSTPSGNANTALVRYIGPPSGAAPTFGPPLAAIRAPANQPSAAPVPTL